MPHRLSFAVAVFLVFGISAEPAPAAAEAPSLVLVTIDTLRADRLGCYGYHRNTSPNIDAFAEQAILFEHAFTTMATTLPAHASMMTGTYPLTHRVQANVAFIPRSLDDATSLRTLAEMLRDRGYDTAAFVSAAPLKRHSGIDRGFETFSQPSSWQRNGTKTTDRALKWLEKRSEKPFFLWIHYFDPHWPYTSAKPFRAQVDDADRMVEYLETIGIHGPTRKILKANNAYDGEILSTDSAVGRLFDRLKTLGKWKSSVVVLTADHGEGMGQHDWMYHGRIYNEQLQVPLLIKLPFIGDLPPRSTLGDGGSRSRRMVSLVDLLPILSAATRLPISEADRRQFQGIDVLGPESDRDRVFSERVHRKSRQWGDGRRYALTTDSWKYLHSPQDGDSLYDLRRDPHETRDVIEQYPRVAKELKASLSAWIEQYRFDPGSQETPEIDPEVIEQLRALGYTE